MKRLTICLTAAMLLAGCDTHVSVAPNGNDSQACSSTAPFKTFARAYACTTPDAQGAIVSVADGFYPPQTVPDGNKRVMFYNEDRAATVKASSTDGATATLDVGAQTGGVMFSGVHVDGGFNRYRQGLAIHDGGVTFKNASIGNVLDEKGGLVSGPNITFDNVRFHDVRLETEGVHNECLYAIVTERIRIVNSTFTDCATMDVMFTYGDWWTPKPPDWGNGTVERNVFNCPRFENSTGCHYYGLLFNGVAGWSVHGWSVRYNDFPTTVATRNDIGLDKPYQNGVRCGNTGPSIGFEWKGACGSSLARSNVGGGVTTDSQAKQDFFDSVTGERPRQQWVGQ